MGGSTIDLCFSVSASLEAAAPAQFRATAITAVILQPGVVVMTGLLFFKKKLHLDIGTQLKVSLNCVAYAWARPRLLPDVWVSYTGHDHCLHRSI
jgi:hypothetical protein